MKLMTLCVFAGLVGLGVALYFIVQPQDLSDLDGRGPESADGSPRDLKTVLQKSLEGGYELKISEEEINLYLAETLEAEQGGLLGGQVEITDVAVRLEDSRAEVILVREIAGYPLTLSMYLRVEQREQPDGRVTTRIFRDGGKFHESIPRPGVGGRFGRLPVPEGFLHLVMPSFEKLAEVYRDPAAEEPVKEIDFMEDMARIRIEEGRLVLDPQADAAGIPDPVR